MSNCSRVGVGDKFLNSIYTKRPHSEAGPKLSHEVVHQLACIVEVRIAPSRSAIVLWASWPIVGEGGRGIQPIQALICV
jgi:hypothetical protein